MSLSEKAPSPLQLNLRCYKVGIFMAFFFNLKRVFYEESLVAFFYVFLFKQIRKVFVFKGSAYILLETFFSC